jgi:cysteinyl-tRNA synthetase
LIQILDNKCAYVVGGDAYFSVDNFLEYGELSGRKLNDNRAGERVAVDERKKNPADFALWKVKDVPNDRMQHFPYCVL